MANTTFVNGTVVLPAWLQDINDLIYKGKTQNTIWGANVKDPKFAGGAGGAGVTDDTAAINAAIASGAKKIIFPAGTYNYTTLNLDAAIGVTFVGDGAISSTVLNCTSPLGTPVALSIRSSFDCTFSLITFSHSDNTFTGYLVDATHSSATSTQGLYFDRCTFTSAGFNLNTAKGVNVDQCTLVTFNACKFVGLVRGVDGQNPLGGSFSNQIKFVDCQSSGLTGYFANYLGQGWTLERCNFQPCVDGKQRIIFSPTAVSFLGVALNNCTVYDVVAGNTSYINVGPGAGLSVNGGLWGGIATATMINATGIINGLRVKGVTASNFTTISNAMVAGNTGWDLGGANAFTGATNIINNVANVLYPLLNGNDTSTSLGVFATNGWRQNDDGTIEMWGTKTGVTGGTTATVTFLSDVGISFPTACYNFTCAGQALAVTTNVVSAAIPSTTSCVVSVSGTGTNAFTWRAIGR